MKKVLLFDANGVLTAATPVHVIARLNGITVRQVGALLNAWHELGAIKPRPGGGYYVTKRIEPKDPRALAIVADRPHAPAPVMAR